MTSNKQNNPAVDALTLLILNAPTQPRKVVMSDG